MVKQRSLNQIFHLCGVSFESIKDLTLPEVSHRVVGSVHSTPPCPFLISTKGKSIRSYEANINPQTTTVLEILTTVSNLTWREVRHAVDASLPDWEFLDSVTLSQLADISGHSVLKSEASDLEMSTVELQLEEPSISKFFVLVFFLFFPVLFIIIVIICLRKNGSLCSPKSCNIC